MKDSFKVGKYYKWIGPKERPIDWNDEGYMDFILDGKTRKCISTRGKIIACFEGQPKGKTNYIDNSIREWAWNEAENYMIEINKEDSNGNLLFDFV